MATLSLSVASDIASAVLKMFVRGPAIKQTVQERPLLRFLTAGAKTFPGGNQYISTAVKGGRMADTVGFLSGYQEDTSVNFGQSGSLLRAEYLWYEVHAGLIITWTELKKDGITISDDQKKSEHAEVALIRLTSLLEDRMDDFADSYSFAMNQMLWKDGSQDSLQVPGVQSLIVDDNTGKTTGGLARNTYSYWRNRTFPGGTPVAASADDQTLSKELRKEVRQLRRFGGKPNKILCGSAFLGELEKEVEKKGIYTDSGFTKNNDIGMADISMLGVGRFEYDPTMDDLAIGNVAIFFDSRRIRLRPMEGEANKVMDPPRPYQYMVFLKSMTWTGGLEVTQLNCHGYYAAAVN